MSRAPKLTGGTFVRCFSRFVACLGHDYAWIRILLTNWNILQAGSTCKMVYSPGYSRVLGKRGRADSPF